jgi:uncharacterized protein YbaR (Trm112 family)
MGFEPWLLEILACPCPEHASLEVREPAGGATEGVGQPGSDNAPGQPGREHAPDQPGRDEGAFVCTRCHTSFPIRDGIPVLLLDEAEPGPRGVGADLASAP